MMSRWAAWTQQDTRNPRVDFLRLHQVRARVCFQPYTRGLMQIQHDDSIQLPNGIARAWNDMSISLMDPVDVHPSFPSSPSAQVALSVRRDDAWIHHLVECLHWMEMTSRNEGIALDIFSCISSPGADSARDKCSNAPIHVDVGCVALPSPYNGRTPSGDEIADIIDLYWMRHTHQNLDNDANWRVTDVQGV